MIVDPIQLPGISPAQSSSTAGIQPADFKAALENGLGNVQNAVNKADSLLRSYAAGGDIAVHDLVIAMEKAKFSLQLAVEVRNRLVESYQEFMRMQL